MSPKSCPPWEHCDKPSPFSASAAIASDSRSVSSEYFARTPISSLATSRYASLYRTSTAGASRRATANSVALASDFLSSEYSTQPLTSAVEHFNAPFHSTPVATTRHATVNTSPSSRYHVSSEYLEQASTSRDTARNPHTVPHPSSSPRSGVDEVITPDSRTAPSGYFFRSFAALNYNITPHSSTSALLPSAAINTSDFRPVPYINSGADAGRDAGQRTSESSLLTPCIDQKKIYESPGGIGWSLDSVNWVHRGKVVFFVADEAGGPLGARALDSQTGHSEPLCAFFLMIYTSSNANIL